MREERKRILPSHLQFLVSVARSYLNHADVSLRRGIIVLPVISSLTIVSPVFHLLRFAIKSLMLV